MKKEIDFGLNASSPLPGKGQGQSERLSGWRLARFSWLAVPIYAVQTPLTLYLPAIYAKQFGLSLTIIGTIFLIERLWGAVADPLIGALSDRTVSHWGRRRPWIVAGSIIFALTTASLFFPAFGVSPVYLGASLFLFHLGWSMIQIPYLAWSGEISGNYHERTRIQTYQTVASSFAFLLILSIAAALDQFWSQDSSLKLTAMGSVVLITLAVGVTLALRAFPDPPVMAVQAVQTPASFTNTLRAVAGDGLLMRILLSDFFVTTGQFIRSTLFVFFVSFYMRAPQWASLLFMLQFIFGVAAGPIWLQVGRAMGKHRAAVTGELTQAAINLGILFVSPDGITLLLALTVAQGLAQGSGNLMLKSLVADVADRHRLLTGHDRTALFFSAFSISMKAGMAAAVGIALPLIAWLGFDPAAEYNTSQVLRNLLYVFALGPALAHVGSAWLIHNFPLDEVEHSKIRNRLAKRDGVQL